MDLVHLVQVELSQRWEQEKFFGRRASHDYFEV